MLFENAFYLYYIYYLYRCFPQELRVFEKNPFDSDICSFEATNRVEMHYFPQAQQVLLSSPSNSKELSVKFSLQFLVKISRIFLVIFAKLSILNIWQSSEYILGIKYLNIPGFFNISGFWINLIFSYGNENLHNKHKNNSHVAPWQLWLSLWFWIC